MSYVSVELDAVFAAARKRLAYGLHRRNELRDPIFQYTSRLESREAIGGLPAWLALSCGSPPPTIVATTPTSQ